MYWNETIIKSSYCYCRWFPWRSLVTNDCYHHQHSVSSAPRLPPSVCVSLCLEIPAEALKLGVYRVGIGSWCQRVSCRSIYRTHCELTLISQRWCMHAHSQSAQRGKKWAILLSGVSVGFISLLSVCRAALTDFARLPNIRQIATCRREKSWQCANLC